MSKIKDIIDLCTDVFLIRWEGYHKRLPNGDCQSYPDPATKNDPVKKGKPWTIGYGSTYHADGRLVVEGEVWTKDYSLKVKKQVVYKFLSSLLRLSPSLIKEPNARVAAVLSFIYNLGTGNYRISTFKRRIDSGDWVGAAEECVKWSKGNGKVMRGLLLRRKHEALVIRNGAA